MIADVLAWRRQRAGVAIRSEPFELIEPNCGLIQIRDIEYEPRDTARSCPGHDHVDQSAANPCASSFGCHPHRQEPRCVGSMLVALAAYHLQVKAILARDAHWAFR